MKRFKTTNFPQIFDNAFRPSDEDGLLVRTKGNIPDQPLPPKWKKNPDNVVELWWAPTATNGFPIVRYVLEMRGTEYLDNLVNDNDTQKRTRDFPAVLHSAWKPIYNGSGSWQIINT